MTDHIIGRILAVTYFVLLVLWAIAIHIMPAKAHGPAEWIQRGGYTNNMGEFCCGERDCHELPSDDVAITKNGYFIIHTGDTVPFNEAIPSLTGTYWLCAWNNRRKCFFAPPGTI